MRHITDRRFAGAYKVQKQHTRIKLLFISNVFLSVFLLLSCIISPYETYSDFRYGIRGIGCLLRGKSLKPCVCITNECTAHS